MGFRLNTGNTRHLLCRDSLYSPVHHLSHASSGFSSMRCTGFLHYAFLLWGCVLPEGMWPAYSPMCPGASKEAAPSQAHRAILTMRCGHWRCHLRVRGTRWALREGLRWKTHMHHRQQAGNRWQALSSWWSCQSPWLPASRPGKPISVQLQARSTNTQPAQALAFHRMWPWSWAYKDIRA